MKFCFCTPSHVRASMLFKDTRHNAENARAALDGKQHKGRFLRVRFAAHGAALRVKYLSQHVSNEMLEDTFSMFGDVERAVVVVDDRGRPTGDGIVEFSRKTCALAALKRISMGVFLMTSYEFFFLLIKLLHLFLLDSRRLISNCLIHLDVDLKLMYV